MQEFFSRAETIMGSTFLRWEDLTESGREQAFYHIKKTSRFLENTYPEVFEKLTGPVQDWLSGQDKSVDKYLAKIDGYEIRNKKILIYENSESPTIPLQSASKLLSLVQGDSPYKFGDFIRMSVLIRDENYLYSHFALREMISEKI